MEAVEAAAGEGLIPMTPLAGSPKALTDLCRKREAFETAPWAIDAILRVELTSPVIVDPCSGTGLIGHIARLHGLAVEEIDIEDWAAILPPGSMRSASEPIIGDFLSWQPGGADLTDRTVVMNPPFSLACEFVDKAHELGARKIICFQRQAWRESKSRRAWWEAHSPARVWVCGERATCWRFDLLGLEHRSGTTASMAWYVWEREHKPSEITSAIYSSVPA